MTRGAEWKIESATKVVQKFVPEFRIKNKKDSYLHNIIGLLMHRLGNKSYMTHFWTTIGYTAWRPENVNSDSWSVVMHEGRHAQQAKLWSRPVMGFFYLIPQSLAPIACAVLGLWHWWLFPIGLFLLAPIPAYFRMRMELDAYTVSMAIDYWRTECKNPKCVDWYIPYFSGNAYYKMWPFNNEMRKRLLKKYEDIMSGLILNDPYMLAIYTYMQSEGMLKV